MDLQLLTCQQVAGLLVISVRHVRRLIDTGRLKAVRLGRPCGPTSRGRWRVYQSSVREYLGEPVPSSKVSADEGRLHAALASMGFEQVDGRVRRVSRGPVKH